jgi:hypothetical protein
MGLLIYRSMGKIHATRFVVGSGYADLTPKTEVRTNMSEQKGKTLMLVGGDTNERLAATRKSCADLNIGYRLFNNGEEKSLRAGMLAVWKEGMKNRKTPDYGAPMIVVDVLSPAVIDTTFDSGSVYFRERLDLVLGFVEEDGEFTTLHYDSRRFEPFDLKDFARA